MCTSPISRPLPDTYSKHTRPSYIASVYKSTKICPAQTGIWSQQFAKQWSWQHDVTRDQDLRLGNADTLSTVHTWNLISRLVFGACNPWNNLTSISGFQLSISSILSKITSDRVVLESALWNYGEKTRPEDQSWCKCDKEYQPLPKPPSQNRVFGWNFESRRLVRSVPRPRLTCFLHSSLTLPPSSGWNQAHLASAGSSKWSGLIQKYAKMIKIDQPSSWKCRMYVSLQVMADEGVKSKFTDPKRSSRKVCVCVCVCL